MSCNELTGDYPVVLRRLVLTGLMAWFPREQ